MRERRTQGDNLTGRRNVAEEDLEQRLFAEWEKYKKERNDRLHYFFVRIVAIFAALGFTMSATVYYVYTTSRDNKNGLCAIRHDSERRVVLGSEFLKENPNGIPGISSDSLRRSTNNAKQTVQSLASLNCPPVEEVLIPEESPIP